MAKQKLVEAERRAQLDRIEAKLDKILELLESAPKQAKEPKAQADKPAEKK